MGAKKTVQKQSQSNKDILRVGQSKKRLAEQIYDPARAHALKSARRDDSKLYRGRASADAAKAFGKPTDSVFRGVNQRGGAGLGSVLKVSNAAKTGTQSALSEGTKRGVLSRDTNIANMINLGVGSQAQSSRAMLALSQAEFQRMKASAEIAAKEANDMRGAAMGLASLGAGKFMEGKNEALDAENQRAFEYETREGGDYEGASFSDWAHSTKGKDYGYKNKHNSFGYNFLNNFSGTG